MGFAVSKQAGDNSVQFKFMWAVCASAALLLTGCSSSQTVQQQEIKQPERVTTGSHRVSQGDTLWSIAFRFGWDWKDLAQANGIQPPYTIYPGQVIRFDGSGSSPAYTPAPVGVAAVAPVQSKPVVQTPPVTSTVSNVRPVVAQPSTVVAAPKSAEPTPTSGSSGAGASSGWAWPANGAVISRFASNGSLNKGIDIAGQLGQPVQATADGTVVYAGSGLRGYGELVIIKHNDTFVSAYGHNQRLLVREGQQVKTGQTIAEMGSTGTDRVKLHFEIRRQGKPVDPLQYLPNR